MNLLDPVPGVYLTPESRLQGLFDHAETSARAYSEETGFNAQTRNDLWRIGCWFLGMKSTDARHGIRQAYASYFARFFEGQGFEARFLDSEPNDIRMAFYKNGELVT